MKRGVRLACTYFASLLITACGAHAGAQARETAGGPGASVTAGGGLSLTQAVYGQRELGGAFVFADFSPHSRFDVEAEARFLRVRSAEQVTERNYLVGPRAVLTTGRERLYVKFLAGDGHIEMPFQYGRGDFLALVPGGGVDMDLTEFATLRIVDFEYQMWRNFPLGTLRPYGISTAISFRLTPIVRLPKGVRVRHDGRRTRGDADEY